MKERARRIAANVRRLRIDAGLNQSQLGRLAGINHGTVSLIEKGSRARIDTLYYIADAMGVGICEILGER